MNRKDMALASSAAGCNCAQSVLIAYCEDFGLDEPTALRLCEGFGGGVAGNGMLCGALSGAVAVLGLYAGRTQGQDAKQAKARTNMLCNKLLAGFKQELGYVDCSALLGHDIATPEGSANAMNSGARKRVCPSCIALACELLDKILQDD
ncbi:MAG: C-GCAxxG-C-C family protein [Clostridia bacterium]